MPKVRCRRDRSSLELAGRTALVRKSRLVIARTELARMYRPLALSPLRIAQAKPCHVVDPEFVACTRPCAAANLDFNASMVGLEEMIAETASARESADVGAPNWSATTSNSSRSPARRQIVLRKLLPCAA